MFSLFGRLPMGMRSRRGRSGGGAKNVRMTADHFPPHAGEDVPQCEPSALLAQQRQDQRRIEYIAKFFLYRARLAPADGGE